jgi:hypothetical protein
MLLVASKVDAASPEGRLRRLRRFCADQGKPLYEISSVTGEGLDDLKRAAWNRLEQIPRPATPDTAAPVLDTKPARQKV